MPKRRLLGCSFPVLVAILTVLLSLFVVSFLSGPLGKTILGDLGLPSWLSVSQSEPELPAEVVFHLFGFPVTNSIVGAWLTILVLVTVSFLVTRRMKFIPGRRQSAFEALLGWLYDFCRNAAGEKDGRRFFPVVATIFLFVGFNAWLSLLPGFGSILITNPEGKAVPLLRAANTDINMPLAIAIMAVFFVQYFGLRTLGLHYVSKFLNVGGFFRSVPLIVRGKISAGLTGMLTGVVEMGVGLLEFLSEFIHILSFTFRLFGNMTAGEILLLVAVFLIPWPFVSLFYGLELLIGFIQALIFGGLTLIFLTLAVAAHEDEAA